MGRIVQLQGRQAANYRSYLDAYRKRNGMEPTAVERTEAFFCAISNDPWKRPSWIA